jgi:hypothetical protein
MWQNFDPPFLGLNALSRSVVGERCTLTDGEPIKPGLI